MREATMLYRSPGSHELHGVLVDYTVVDASAIPEMLAAGWCLSPLEAAAYQPPAAVAAEVVAIEDAVAEHFAPPTRSELEAKATELGIRFDGRTSDKKLGALITASLEA